MFCPVFLAMWYPLVNIQKAIEHGHGNSEFSHKKMVIFHGKLLVITRWQNAKSLCS